MPPRLRNLWTTPLPAGVHVVCRKKYILFLIIFTLLFGKSSFAANGLQVLKVAGGYTYVREKTNHNDAPEINMFLKYVGLAPGNPYCLAFDNFCWGQVVKPNPYPRVGGTVRFMEIAKDHPLRYKIYTPADLILGRGNPTGGIGIYFHNAHAGHAVLFDKMLDLHMFSTIEGNTVGVDTASTAEQRGEANTTTLITTVRTATTKNKNKITTTTTTVSKLPNQQGVYRRVRSNRSSAGMQFQGIVVPR